MARNLDSRRVAVVSTTATGQKSENIARAFALAGDAVNAGAQWIAMPEMFSFHGSYDTLWENAEFESGPLNKSLSEFARRHDVVLFAGSVAERPEGSDSGKVYNTQYVFGRDGRQIAKYRKTHLFNLMDSAGKKLYCESDGYLSGSDLVTLEIDTWKIGLATCYDLRFPGIFDKLCATGPVDAFVIPAAFTFQTGAYHWELLLRARAVENLAYVIAPNQVGTHSPGKQSFGHGMIVDPWGVVATNTGHTEGFAIADIHKRKIAHCRDQLPALRNKRPELYR